MTKLDLANSLPFRGGAKGKYLILRKGGVNVEGLLKLYPHGDGYEKALRHEFDIIKSLKHENILSLLPGKSEFYKDLQLDKNKVVGFVSSPAEFSVAYWIPDLAKVDEDFADAEKDEKEKFMQTISAKVAVALMDTLQALDYIHKIAPGKEAVAHLDVQLNNLFVCNEPSYPTVKLAGFDNAAKNIGDGTNICCEGRILFLEEEALTAKLLHTDKKCAKFKEDSAVLDEDRHYHCSMDLDFFQLAKSMFSLVGDNVDLSGALKALARNPKDAESKIKLLKANVGNHRKNLKEVAAKKH